MKENILVAYASKYGSTKGVAEAVAAALRDEGLDVSLQPVRDVRSLEGYSAVVLGAPFYIGSLHGDARQFLARHQEALVQTPTAFFTLGPTQSKDWPEARGQIDSTLAKLPWFKPVVVEMFGGKYDPALLRFPDTLLAKLPASPLHDMPGSDLRDWDAIRAWAKSLPAALHQAQPVQEVAYEKRG